MTTITIERELLEEVVEIFDNALSTRYPHEILRDIRAALAAPSDKTLIEALQKIERHGPIMGSTGEYRQGQLDILEIVSTIAGLALSSKLNVPATAPEFPASWAQMIHYPECWDTAAYPDLSDAIHEALAWSGCSVCKPATAPAWHDAPTCAGLWLCDEGDENPYRFTCHDISMPLNPHLVGEGECWYGPIPKDKS